MEGHRIGDRVTRFFTIVCELIVLGMNLSRL